MNTLSIVLSSWHIGSFGILYSFNEVNSQYMQNRDFARTPIYHEIYIFLQMCFTHS